MIQITPDLAIDETEIDEQFVRASGPGGQNVNKVSTAVQLRFDALHSPSLPDHVKSRLVKLAGRRINDHGILIIDARAHRTQRRNRDEALARLIDLIRRATEVPKPRHKTRPTAASKERRLADKRQRGERKRERTGLETF